MRRENSNREGDKESYIYKYIIGANLTQWPSLARPYENQIES